MKDKFAKLINVKSLVTLILTLVVAYKAIMGQMNIEQIYLMIIAFLVISFSPSFPLSMYVLLWLFKYITS